MNLKHNYMKIKVQKSPWALFSGPYPSNTRNLQNINEIRNKYFLLTNYSKYINRVDLQVLKVSEQNDSVQYLYPLSKTSPLKDSPWGLFILLGRLNLSLNQGGIVGILSPTFIHLESSSSLDIFWISQICFWI